jgi:hypothetical protein
MSNDSPNVIDIAAYRKEGRELRFGPLPGGGGGGTFDGMEARVAKVEATLEHIQRDISDIKGDVRTQRENSRSDFRVLFGAIITVALGLAGIMARGFHWL